MELRIYEQAAGRPAQGRAWVPGWVEAFERWAAPEVAPELADEQERSLLPVAVLLALALLGQLAQLAIPEIREYLETGNFSQRPTWIGFTILKQWALFALMAVVLRVKDERLESIGWPQLDLRRVVLGFGLVAFGVALALLYRPAAPDIWMVPYWPGERVLYVGLMVTTALVEETFFRGFAVVWLYRWSGHLPLAVLFPAVIFAAGHAYWGWLNVLFAFGVGVGFSVLFIWRRDLYWPMVIHYAVNGTALVS